MTRNTKESKFYSNLARWFLVGAAVLVLAAVGLEQTENFNSEISFLVPLVGFFGFACILPAVLFEITAISERRG